MKYHFCLDIRGALLNWSHTQWRDVGQDNKMTAHEVKAKFMDYLAEGKKVIPIHKECDNFCYQKGCLGHKEDTDSKPDAIKESE